MRPTHCSLSFTTIYFKTTLNPRPFDSVKYNLNFKTTWALQYRTTLFGPMDGLKIEGPQYHKVSYKMVHCACPL